MIHLLRNNSTEPSDVFDAAQHTNEQSPRQIGDIQNEHSPQQQEHAQEFSEYTSTPVQDESSIEETIDTLKQKLKKKPRQIASKPPQVKDALTLQVEKIMEQGLVDAYKSMTMLQQQQFKMAGEDTAAKIRQLLQKTRTKMKKIFFLILSWLKRIPGVNLFYLEQEAKIKAEKIFALKQPDQHK